MGSCSVFQDQFNFARFRSNGGSNVWLSDGGVELASPYLSCNLACTRQIAKPTAMTITGIEISSVSLVSRFG